MKKTWFSRLACAWGVIGASTALAQYPAYNKNTGPSSFPVQQPSTYQLTNWQDSVPSVPNGGAYDVPSPAVQPHAPLPMAQPYMPASPAPQVYGSQPAAPSAAYAPQSIMAPGCSTCGPTAGTQMYAPAYTPAPAPYAYSAPSIGSCGTGYGYGYGYGSSCSTCGPSVGGGNLRGHFSGGLPVGAKPWFFGGGALIFRRVDDYNRLLTVNDVAGAGILYTRDAAMPTMAGFELMGGRYFNCGKNAIMASYWGLFPDNQMVAVTDTGDGVRSSLWRPWAGPDPATGEFQLQAGAVADPLTDNDVYNLYDTATTHRLRRSSKYNNIEINLLGFGVGGAARSFNRSTAGTMFSGTRNRYAGGGYGACGSGCGPCGGYEACSSCGDYNCGGDCCADASRYATGPCGYVAPGCGSKLNLSWLAGVRYLQFKDNLEYAAYGGATLGANVLSYDVHTVNNLVGFQLGGRADYCVGRRMNLYSMGKVGIYGNTSSLESRLGTASYLAYASNDPTMPYSVSRSQCDVAFLSELGTGLGYRVSPKWTATVGYRAIVASGVATAVGNMRYQGQRVSQTNLNATDCLILHGLNVGAIYNF